MNKWDSIVLWLLAVVILFCPSTSVGSYGLGRRIVFEDPVAAVTTRYYYDGQSVIEERDGACPGINCDARLRFHVNGAQFIDERVTTFEDSTGEFTYYLVNQSFSVTGMGNADGSVIDRLDYSSTGDFAGGGPGASSFFHDADVDLDLDLRDFASFQNCFGETNPTCLAVHDFDTADVSDGNIDLDDYARFVECSRGPFITPDQACGQPIALVVAPQSGTFTLHGRPVDILSDGHALIPIRARYYDAANGRWLQRDSKGYVDGGNLYESFRGNATTNVDPLGTEVWAEARRVKTTLNGVPVWRVDYVLNKDGVSLGFGGLIWGSAVESQHAGTEFFRFTDDLREIRRIDSLMENQRGILESLQVANIQIASLEQGIKTAATVAVALPVAAVAAPVAGTVFGSSLVGTTAAGATTGAVSFGAGGATGEALIGGSLTDIAIAGGTDAAFGAAFGGVLGAGGKLFARGSAAANSSVRTSASQVGRSVRFDPKVLRFRDVASGRFVATSEALQTTTFSRAVSAGELQAILESNTIQSLGGRTFFTINPSLRATRVQLRLGLEGPLREFRVDFRMLNRPNVVGPQRVQAVPNVPGSGGGIEFVTTDPLNVQLTRVRALRRAP